MKKATKGENMKTHIGSTFAMGIMTAFASVHLFAAGSIVLWTGGGLTSDWSDADNWQGGILPDFDSVVQLDKNSEIRVSSNVYCDRFENVGEHLATLTLDCPSDIRLNARLVGNIRLEKKGAGALTLVGAQEHTGGIIVSAGTVIPTTDFPSGVYRSYGTVSAHVDVSDLATLTLGVNGEILAWRSLSDNNLSLLGGEVAYPDAAFFHGNPYLTEDAMGRHTVRFGRTPDGVTAKCTYFAFGETDGSVVSRLEKFRGRTMFIVQRQAVNKADCGLLGMVTNYSYRIWNSSGGANYWFRGTDLASSTTETWNNGRKANNSNAVTFEASGIDYPNLLVTRTSSGSAAKEFDIIGDQFLWDASKAAANPRSNQRIQDIYEFILFEDALSDQQVSDITGMLMKKWSIPEQAVTCCPDMRALYVTVGTNAVLDVSDTKEMPRITDGTGFVMIDGETDLNGGSVGPVKVVGEGFLTNKADVVAKIVVNSDDDLEFAADVRGSVDVVKRGSGALSLKRGLKIEGDICLEGGTIKAAEPDYAAMGSVSVHLDASKADSITTDSEGRLVSWRSSDSGNKIYQGAKTVYPDIRSFCNNPYVFSDSQGRRVVRFGRDKASASYPTFITQSDGAKTSGRTFFLVMRANANSGDGGILGMIVDYDFRIFRTGNYQQCQYRKQNMAEAWVSGRKSTTDDDVTFLVSGQNHPHLLVVRNGTAKEFDIFGGQYLFQGSMDGNINDASAVCGKYDLYEALLFTSDVSDEDVAYISQYLMMKWGIPEEAKVEYEVGCGLPTNVSYHVSAASTIDCGSTNAFLAARALVVDAHGTNPVPILSVNGSLDATGLPLDFVDMPRGPRSKFLSATGLLKGEFSLTHSDLYSVTMDAAAAYVRLVSGFMFVVW